MMCGIFSFISIKYNRGKLPADEVLVALTVGMKNKSSETTAEILTRELPSHPFLAILVMQHKYAFKCTELKAG